MEALPELASLIAAGQLSVPIWRTYPLAQAALAHRVGPPAHAARRRRGGAVAAGERRETGDDQKHARSPAPRDEVRVTILASRRPIDATAAREAGGAGRTGVD